MTTNDKPRAQRDERSLLQIVISLQRQAERTWDTTKDEWTRTNAWSSSEAYKNIIEIINRKPYLRLK